MSEIEITTDPTSEQVDIDLEKADMITVIHSGSKLEVKDFLDNYVNNELKPVYCHYYTENKTYTIGLKVIKK